MPVAFLNVAITLAERAWEFWQDVVRHKERVEPCLECHIDSGGCRLLLKLRNQGRVPIYMEKPVLAWGDEGCPSRAWGWRRGHGSRVAGRSSPSRTCRWHFEADPPCHNPLQPGECRNYVLPALPIEVLKEACDQPRDKVWISVSSGSGEILRLKGDRVLPHLRTCLEGSLRLNSG